MNVIRVLLISSFEIASYSDFGWYQKEYEKYDVLTDLEMEMDDAYVDTHEDPGISPEGINLHSHIFYKLRLD